LRDVVVLAEPAREVASRRAEAEDRRAGKEMVEGLLLDGIDAEARRPSIGCQNHGLARAGAHETQAPLAVLELAFARADVALQASVREPRPMADRGAGNAAAGGRVADCGLLGHARYIVA